MMNARSMKMSFEASASEFAPAITLKKFYASRVLIFYKFLKMSENIIKIIFEFQKIEPSKLWIIINEKNVTGKSQIWFDGERASFIAMNEI